MRFTHIIIDGNNLARKNFYTHRDLSTVVKGETVRTGTAFGSLSSLVSLSKNWLDESGSIIVAWDRGHTRKSKIYPDYKKERRENRDEEEYADYNEQRRLLERLLKLTRFSSAYANGEEADDVMATLVMNIVLACKDAEVLIVSSDRDMHQLIGKNVSQMIISARGKESIYTPEHIEKAYGVEPHNYLTIQLMTGDKGDGVPGIYLLGPKTALKIINASTKEEIKQFLISEGQKLPKALIEWLKKKGRSLSEVRKLFGTTYNLLKLKRNIPDVKIRRGKNNENRLIDLFMEYEFMSFLKGKRIRELVHESS